MIEFIFWWFIAPTLPFVIFYAFKNEFYLIKLKILNLPKDLKPFKFYRKLRGGLWIYFYDGNWERCRWAENESLPGYIHNYNTGGMFHRSFNGIVILEDHDNGEEWYNDDYETLSNSMD